MTRRRVLLTPLGAGAAFPGEGSGTPLAEAGIPDTLAAFSEADRSLHTPGFPIGHLGVSWSGPRVGGSYRFRRARTGWGPWLPLSPGDPSTSGRRTALLPAGRAVAYQLDPPPGAVDVQAVAINTTDGPIVAEPVESLRLRGFRFVSRAGWGADESLRFAPDGSEIFPPAYFGVQALTVHHTATANLDPNPAATVRAIYFFHTVCEDFGDLGYHLLIDQTGTVYEGRHSGPDPTPVFNDRLVDDHLVDEPRMSNGAHVGGFNAGNVGIALLGDFTSTIPTPAAHTTLTQLLAALSTSTGVDPLAQLTYVNPISGATRTVPTISTHRNWTPTTCPGDTFHLHLPAIRADVHRLLLNG